MRTIILFAVFSATLVAAEPSVFDVKTFGAAGDRHGLDTTAIQKAIDACHDSGGGVVYFPAGDFLSGTITLKSRVTLRLSPGATLWGSTRIGDYPQKHLIEAHGVENVAIDGGGTIDGQGDAFLDKNLRPLPRPSPLIEIEDSKGLRIEDITIRRAPAWTVHPKNCDDVKIRGVSLLNNLNAINTDGLDIDSSRNVLISDCHIEAGDDCIVLKTSSRGGPAGPTENVVVSNCVLVSASSALKLGTESFGDFRHCLFSNCVIRDSRTGIALLAKDGGTMEDIRFTGITMTTKPEWGKGLEWPIEIDIERRSEDSKLSHIRDVSFNGITIGTKGRILAEGMPESPIESLSFRDVDVRMGGFEDLKDAHKMRGTSQSVAAGNLDYGSVHAAFIFAHVRGLTLDGVELSWSPALEAPERNALYGDDIHEVHLEGFHALASTGSAKAVVIDRSPEIAP